jgi:hypothetical protein
MVDFGQNNRRGVFINFLDDGLNINWRSHPLVLMFSPDNIHNRNLFKKYLIN